MSILFKVILNSNLAYVLKESWSRNWRAGPAVKKIYSSCRRPKFSSQYSHGSSQQNLIPVSEIDALFCYLFAPAHKLTYTHTYTQKNKEFRIMYYFMVPNTEIKYGCLISYIEA